MKIRTEDGIWIRRADDVAKQAYSERVFGRLTAERVVDPVTGEIIAEKGAIVDHALAKKIMFPMFRN
jgi:DNA-directed RNA polymerase subunit beta'